MRSTVQRVVVGLWLTLGLIALPVVAADQTVGMDAFGRSTTGGWGTADQGGAWTTVGGANPLRVTGGWGTMALPSASAGRAAVQGALSVRDVELTTRVRLDRLPAAGSAYAYLVGRRRGTTEYRLKARVSTSGAVYVQATRVVSGAETGVGAETKIGGVTLAAGSALRLRGRFVGAEPTRLRLRVWAGGAAEPTGWAVDQADSTASLEAAGAPGLRAYLGSGVSNGPVTIGFDDWSATALDLAPTPEPTPPPTPEPTPPPGLLGADSFARSSSSGLSPSGAVDTAGGIVQFVVGTGGVGGATFPRVREHSVIRNGDTYGILKLTLRPGSYDWQFIPVAGRSFTDSGSASCHVAP